MMKMIDDLKNFDLKSVDFKDPRTQTLLLTVVVALAAALLYLYFIFVPQVTRVCGLVSNTFKMSSELKSSRIMIKDLERFKLDLKEQGQKVESYEKKLPAEQEIPALLENLSNMARDSGINIVSIAPAMLYPKDDKTAKKSSIYREIPIVITAKSGYHELGRFLSNLENSDRFMKVADIGIKADKKYPNKHDVELTVCTYVLLPENK